MDHVTNNPTILCVDSDPVTADWITAMLARAQIDCEIETADKGRDAFGRLVSGDIDLCVLEYALPDMTGVQLCGLFRQVGGRVPMLFFSVMNRNIDRSMAFGAGADEYLTKPDDLDIFADAVKFLLKRRRPVSFTKPSDRIYASAA
jgi:DNA-binding response OmpR family regulator